MSENENLFYQMLEKRNGDKTLVAKALAFNEERKKLVTATENKKAQINKLSGQIGELKKNKQPADELMGQVAQLKIDMAQDQNKLEEIEKEQKYVLSIIPNRIADDVPVGTSEKDNKELFRKGTPKTFSFEVKDHGSLGENLGMLDFEIAAKMTGARFVVYKKDLARMERALINFMIDEHVKNGYEEILPPFIVNQSTLYGTGQLPKFKEDVFKLEGQEWYLIPTAEVPLTNLKREEIFSADEFPLQYVAHTPCFRSEAGSYGKDTKGLIRQHQFNKVELVNIVSAEDSERAHEAMIKRACSILELLELPYRALLLCSSDMGFGAYKTVDLEVWLPSQNTYREISSISNCWDFQARRASIRYRDKDGKPAFAHTLNGSGLAVGRTLLAIMENYQNADGSITVPKALISYMGGVEKIAKNA